MFRNGLFWLKDFRGMAKTGPFMFLLDNHTPRRGALPRRRSLHLGEPEPKFSEFSGSPRHSSNAPPRQTFPPKCSIASLRRTCKSCFGSSLLLIITIIHWINEVPNK